MDDAVVDTPENNEQLSDEELLELETLTAAGQVRPGLPWATYLRCLLLTAIIVLVGIMTWRPGVLRFSLIMSMGNPSPGTDLAWKPTPEPEPPLPERKRVLPPSEWRLGPVMDRDRDSLRPGAKETNPAAPPINHGGWRRFSYNPWRWDDDAGDIARRHVVGADLLPPQKPESSFRAADPAAWVEQPAPVTAAATIATPDTPGTVPPLPALSAGMPLPDLPGPTAGLSLPPLPAPIANADASALVATPAAPAPEAEAIDWKTREITGPIENAYLTIYPKLKFIGLCVPGQGYIRKYNQIGVPADLTTPKATAQDGRTPYGKYYIADRHRDADGPRLYLSWPSPEDAVRAGLDPVRLAEVESAWRRKELPPQDTAAGGGVGLNGLRNWVETTEGGFTLEAPHMEEIFTALPDDAWVFVQP